MAQFPHCDSLVLHRPGVCHYCDMYPDLQIARIIEGVNFTDEGPDPATERRSLEVIYRWYGNRAKILEDIADDQIHWDNIG